MAPTRTARTRTRARRGEGARLREEILDAATRLLVETGDEGSVSVRAVADLVGVTFGLANPEPYRIMFMSPHHEVPADLALAAMGLWSALPGITSVMIAKAVEPIAFPWPDVTALTEHVMDVHLAALAGLHRAEEP